VEKAFYLVKTVAVTFVVVCRKCGGLLLAKADQKTRTCPYCDSKVILEGAKKLGSAKTSHEASTLLQRLKQDAAARR
jgi:DNA-directed RNA polymerase subunit RPC12/RpoP